MPTRRASPSRPRADRRGSVLVLAALAVSALILTGAFAIDAALWRIAVLDLQHRADAAAVAGAAQLAAGASAQAATSTAATVAIINGVTGGGPLAWDPASLTTANSLISASVAYGAKNTLQREAILLTLRRRMPAGLSSLARGAGATTVAASARAELDGPGPCLVTLSGDTLSLTNSGRLANSNCLVWSNGAISVIGSARLEAAEIYAVGAITTSGAGAVVGNRHPGSTALADPYAGQAAVTQKVATLSAGAGSPARYTTGSVTLSPGVYSSWNFNTQARVTLQPGTYTVNGDILVANQAQLTGAGVTIVTSGSVTFQQSTVVTLSAPTGGSGGLVLISTGALLRIINVANVTLTGVVYAPSASFETVNSPTIASTDCLEMIVLKATIINTVSFTPASCGTMGALSFGRKPLLSQ